MERDSREERRGFDLKNRGYETRCKKRGAFGSRGSHAWRVLTALANESCHELGVCRAKGTSSRKRLMQGNISKDAKKQMTVLPERPSDINGC